MQNKVIGIYKITSPTGKIYIGQSANCVRRKWYYRRGYCERQTKLYHSILKHGWDNHLFEVIHPCKREELNDLEIYYIILFNCFNTEHGLNLTSGGKVIETSDETKKIQSKLALERLTDKTKLDKLIAQIKSVDNKGSKNGRYGTGRKVSQFDLRYNFIKEHISYIQAANFSGVGHGNIYNVLNKKRNCVTAGGFIWRYSDSCVTKNGVLFETKNK